MDNRQIAATLFKALEDNDADCVRPLCAPDFTAIQNNGPMIDLDHLLKFSSAVNQVVPDLNYTNVICTETEHGFVVEHDVCGTLADGSCLNLKACVVAEVTDGKITTMREYFDSAAATNLVAALSK